MKFYPKPRTLNAKLSKAEFHISAQIWLKVAEGWLTVSGEGTGSRVLLRMIT